MMMWQKLLLPDGLIGGCAVSGCRSWRTIHITTVVVLVVMVVVVVLLSSADASVLHLLMDAYLFHCRGFVWLRGAGLVCWVRVVRVETARRCGPRALAV